VSTGSGNPHDVPEIVDPDVDLIEPDEPGRPARHGRVLAAIAVGGAVGAEARYGVALLLPHTPGAWPWATLLTNVSGCLLIGVLMVLVTERFRAHPLVRPLLGVGVLGGYTTFSTYAVDAVVAVGAGGVGPALLYLVATPLLAVAAVAAGSAATRALVPTRVAAA
jgi:fluoride exporter